MNNRFAVAIGSGRRGLLALSGGVAGGFKLLIPQTYESKGDVNLRCSIEEFVQTWMDKKCVNVSQRLHRVCQNRRELTGSTRMRTTTQTPHKDFDNNATRNYTRPALTSAN